eukprot:1137602-Pelagomonas_calceolata.AAC.6
MSGPVMQSCLALTPEDATIEQQPPPPKEPSSPSSVSSTFEHDLSEEEDRDLMGLCQVCYGRVWIFAPCTGMYRCRLLAHRRINDVMAYVCLPFPCLFPTFCVASSLSLNGEHWIFVTFT